MLEVTCPSQRRDIVSRVVFSCDNYSYMVQMGAMTSVLSYAMQAFDRWAGGNGSGPGEVLHSTEDITLVLCPADQENT